MTIEELPGSGGGRQPDGSPWTTTVLTLGAGIVLGVVVMWAIGSQAAPAPSAPPGSSAVAAQASPSARHSLATPFPQAIFPRDLDPSVRQPLIVDDVSFSFSVPASGWAGYDAFYISKNVAGSPDAEAVIFWARFPDGLYAKACAGLGPEGWDAAELPASLGVHVPGTEIVTGPTDAQVGGLTATQVVLRIRNEYGCGPAFFYTWAYESLRGGPLWAGPLLGDTITVWVFEIAGERFIVASETHLNAGPELEDEVQQVIDSIEFENQPAVDWSEHLTPGIRHALVVDGVTLTYSVTTWWERYDELYMSRDIVGDDAAEAMVLWTRYPEGRLAEACDWSGDRPDGTTAERLATSLSTGVPGTVLVDGPAEDTVGGAAAIRVELSIQADQACGPGYFLTWEGPGPGHGPSWFGSAPGGTITIWVLDLGGDPFLIVTETTPRASARLADQARQIVHSIDFR